MTLLVAGRVVENFCGSSKEGKKHACRHHDPRSSTCTLPGRTCRGTPENKFTPEMDRRHRLWVAFKAFKTIQVARHRGWCMYHDTDDICVVTQLVEQAGLRVILMKDRDSDPFELVLGPGEPFPGKYNHEGVSINRNKESDDRWIGDPMIEAFTRMDREISWKKRRWAFSLPGFVSLAFTM